MCKNTKNKNKLGLGLPNFVLSVIRYTDFDFLFGIFKLFLARHFLLRCLYQARQEDSHVHVC